MRVSVTLMFLSLLAWLFYHFNFFALGFAVLGGWAGLGAVSLARRAANRLGESLRVAHGVQRELAIQLDRTRYREGEVHVGGPHHRQPRARSRLGLAVDVG